MATLIVGGDSVQPYTKHLMTRGFGPVMHWNGRNKSECHRKIPLRTRLVVILIDQINHGLALKIRRIADEMALPVIFSTRSVIHLERAILGLENASRNTFDGSRRGRDTVSEGRWGISESEMIAQGLSTPPLKGA